MAFTTRRGRPRQSIREATDLGTPELRLKHACGITAEPIDQCFEKQLITPPQHRAALHYRWLYTLRYGAPQLSQRYADRVDAGPPVTRDDPLWRASREREYHEASEMLRQHRLHRAVAQLVIYNELPVFLNPRLRKLALHDAAMAETLYHHHSQLCSGLSLLATHWKK